eukprot:COSAG01_NODE_4484_length_4983_cov_9.058149_2_plen_91_part_00
MHGPRAAAALAHKMTTLCINRTIVEEDGHGFVRLSIAEKPIPSEADLQDDQVHSPCSCSPPAALLRCCCCCSLACCTVSTPCSSQLGRGA